MRAGVVGHATCTDISPGMLSTLRANAARLGLDVDARVADAEVLPFEDGVFDLVFGHAVLHHLPDLDRAVPRVPPRAAPGRRVGVRRRAVAPRRPHRRVPQARRLAAGAGVAAALRAGPARAGHGDGGAENHQLEPLVDVHAFTPEALRAARRAGFDDVRVRGEELLANWFGWANRTLEARRPPTTVPYAWKLYAYRGYLALQQVDARLLEPRLPPAIFYNLMLSAHAPRGRAQPARSTSPASTRAPARRAARSRAGVDGRADVDDRPAAPAGQLRVPVGDGVDEDRRAGLDAAHEAELLEGSSAA